MLIMILKLIIAVMDGLLGILLYFQSGEEKGTYQKILQFVAILLLVTVIAICV